MFINKLTDQTPLIGSVLVPTVTEKLLTILAELGSEKAKDIRSCMLRNLVPDLSINPASYTTAWSYQLDAQAIALISKSVHFDFLRDPKQAAISNWLEAEQQCFLTNKQLLDPSYRRNLSTNVSGILYHMREYLTRLLGPASMVFDTLRFSPGSTFTCRGRHGAFPIKFETDLCLYAHTPLDYVRDLGRNNQLWREACIQRSDKMSYTDHDVVSFVPKNWKTHRAICIGPGLSMHFQLHLAACIRRRLNRWGVDLKTVADSHKQIVASGSLDGALSTIDIAMASDTVSFELVRAVIPPDWFDILCHHRAPKSMMNGDLYTLNKFSAMGNGFTFELETIIFMAACYATAQLSGNKGNAFFSVFGDDIIISTSLAESLIKNLSLVGFTTNPEKTFYTGKFRESCGSDFFGRTNVRPIYLKEFSHDLQGLYQLANRVRDIACRLNDDEFSDSRFHAVWSYILSWACPNLIFLGPKANGDKVVYSSRSEWIGYSTFRNGNLRIRTLERSYSLKSRVRPRSWSGIIGVSLYMLGVDERQNQWSQIISENTPVQMHKGFVHRTTKYRLVTRQSYALWADDDRAWF